MTRYNTETSVQGERRRETTSACETVRRIACEIETMSVTVVVTETKGNLWDAETKSEDMPEVVTMNENVCETETWGETVTTSLDAGNLSGRRRAMILITPGYRGPPS